MRFRSVVESGNPNTWRVKSRFITTAIRSDKFNILITPHYGLVLTLPSNTCSVGAAELGLSVVTRGCCGNKVLSLVATYEAGSKRPRTKYAANMPLVKNGCNIVKGTTYFLDFRSDSYTPCTGLLLGVVPGTCGMTKAENRSSG